MPTSASNLARSASAPGGTRLLPPLAGRAATPAAGRRRGGGGQNQRHPREVFLAGLLNEDLQELSRWHGSRPAHEQKRFLRSVNTLYNAFEKADNGTWAAEGRACQAARQQVERQRTADVAAARAAAVAAMSVEDPLNGPPRETPRGVKENSGASDLCSQTAKPIEVFEQRKRQGFRQSRALEQDPNTLSMWLEGQSVSSHTTANTQSTQMTRFTALSCTSNGSSSICSDPGTTHQLQFRNHKRGVAVNRNKWKAVDQNLDGEMKDGVPNSGFPDVDRLATSFKDAFGVPEKSSSKHVPKEMFAQVLQKNSHPFVENFLEKAEAQQREQFSGMVRSLEYLRKARARKSMSMEKEAMDLDENARLWRPPLQKPVFEPHEINISRVPLGTLCQQQDATAKMEAWATPSTHGDTAPCVPVGDAPPQSPSVSGLGSLPLSRLTTPAVL